MVNDIRSGPGRRPRHGSVLVLVLVVVVILSLAGYSFVTGMYTQHKSVRLHGDLQQLQQVVASGEAYVRQLLMRQEPDIADRRRWHHDQALFCDLPLHPDPEHEWHGWRFTVVAPRAEEGRLGELRYGLMNCSARLHLGRVLQWEAAAPGAGEAALMVLPGMTQDVAQSLLDWLDGDDLPREHGGERDEYAADGYSYAPRNDLPETLDELLLVRGMTRALLYGGDLNQNYQIDPEEEGAVEPDLSTPAGQARPPLAWFLTLRAAERNQDASGAPRIHLNQPDLNLLRELLQAEFGPEVAEFVVAWRQYGPAAETRSAATAAAVATSPAAPSATRRERMRPRRSPARAGTAQPSEPPGSPTLLTSPLDPVGSRVRLPDNQLRESPWNADPQAGSDALEQWLDRTTVSGDSRLEGRINIDWAPREVLQAIPGISDSLVDRISAARNDRTRGPAADRRRSPLWLWREGLADLATLKQLWPYITSGGDLFEAQLIAFAAAGGPYARVRLVLDGSHSPPRRIYWEDLRPLGLGFSLEALTGRRSDGTPSPALTAR